MLQYDLTETPLFKVDASMPTEAETFIVTVALMLVKDFCYSNLKYCELRLDGRLVESVAECIERHLSIFTHDVGHGARLRNRLRSLIGLRIGWFSYSSQRESQAAM